MIRATALTLAVALTVPAASCGEEPASPAPPTKAQYIEDADATCSGLQSDIEAASTERFDARAPGRQEYTTFGDYGLRNCFQEPDYRAHR